MSGKRAPTDRGAAVGRVKPARREGPPLTGRTVTVDELKASAALAAQTLERHDEAINRWLAPLARSLPGQLADLGAAIAKLDGTVSGFATLSADIRRELADHDERIGAVEERGAAHEVRLDILDEIPPRVAALEERRRAATMQEAVETAVVAQQRQWISFGLRHGWKAISVLLAAALTYYGVIK